VGEEARDGRGLGAQRQHEVEQILEGWSIALPREQVIEALTAVDVPVAPVLTMAEVLESEHFHQRGTFMTVDDGIGGTLAQPKDPTGFGIDTPARVPHLGEHRDGVLHEIGLQDEDINELRHKGAFGVQQSAGVTA